MAYPTSATRVAESYDKSHGLSAQFRRVFAEITPDDDTYLDPPARGILVGVAGDLSCLMVDAVVLTSGTVQSGTSTTLVLAAAEAYGNDALNGKVVEITKGKGVGQVRTITDYVGATDTATVAAWTVIPDLTSTYKVLDAQVVPVTAGYHPIAVSMVQSTGTTADDIVGGT